MLKVIISFVLLAVAVFFKGILNLSWGDALLILAAPLILLYKLLGNRPSFLAYVGFMAGILAGSAFFWGYVVAPIQYYHSLWGWYGVLAGIVATLLLPFQLVLFVGVALMKGGALPYVGKFLAELLFGFAGLLLFASTASPFFWQRFRKHRPEDPQI